MSDMIVPAARGGGALTKDNYQSFEMAKEHDGVIGGDNIAQIRSYAAYARAQAQAIHKTIAATSGIEDVAAIKQEALETEQTYAKVGLYADQRIGEILRELPKDRSFHGNQHYEVNSYTQEVTKADAIKDAGISKSQAYDLQAMAANPEVVEAVIAKAEAEGRVASRSQVLDAINERKRAERELRQASIEVTNARMEAEALKRQMDGAREEIAALERQNDELYARKDPEPKVVEREVVRTVEVESQEARRRIGELEHLERLHNEDNQKLREQLSKARKELEQAKGILGMGESTREVQADVQYLIAATNQYVRHYGGLTWTFERIGEVDEGTLAELKKAVKNLATFSGALMAHLEGIK